MPAAAEDVEQDGFARVAAEGGVQLEVGDGLDLGAEGEAGAEVDAAFGGTALAVGDDGGNGFTELAHGSGSGARGNRPRPARWRCLGYGAFGLME